VLAAGCAVDSGGGPDCALDEEATARPAQSTSARGRWATIFMLTPGFVE
jgi:hypothetical protein